MNINKYTSCFHDGGVIDLRHKDDEIILSLSSDQIDPNDFDDDIKLSKDECLRGKLYLVGIKSITINDKIERGNISKVYDSGEIFELEIKGNCLSITLEWFNFPPKEFLRTNFFTYKIESEKIWWETIPDLYDPFLD